VILNLIRCGILSSQKNKVWIWKALDRHEGKTLAWVTGHRDAKTFQRLYEKVKHVKGNFYTDDWEVYSKILPRERHIIGKAGTTRIESDNSNTRHHLGRMTRRTKVVSRSEDRVDLSLRLWRFLQDPSHFEVIREKFMSLF
jgi:insertion element IS1 protein InsB